MGHLMPLFAEQDGKFLASVGVSDEQTELLRSGGIVFMSVPEEVAPIVKLPHPTAHIGPKPPVVRISGKLWREGEQPPRLVLFTRDTELAARLRSS